MCDPKELNTIKRIRSLTQLESRQNSALSMSLSGSFSDIETTNSTASSIIVHTKKKIPRKKSFEGSLNNELKQRTLKQHYYPEGHWGWFIVISGTIVQCIDHGLHLGSAVLQQQINATFGKSIMAGENNIFLYI